MKKYCRFVLSAVVLVAMFATAAAAQTCPTASNTGPYTAGDTISLLASSPDPTATYAWAGPGFNSNQQNPTIANAGAINAGDYSVTANGCIATTTVVVNPQPTISINSVSGQAGLKGTMTAFKFTISLTIPSTQVVSVEYYTSNGTAVAGRDYQTTSGTATFKSGDTVMPVTVNVYGTTTNPQKTFLVNIYEPVNATIQTLYGYNVRGKGTILAK